MFFYAIIENETNIVIEVLSSEIQITASNYNQITEEQYNDSLFLGSLYNAENNTYTERYTPIGNVYELRDETGKKTYKKVMSEQSAAFLAHGHTASGITETEDRKIMTAAEREKLSNISENANSYTHPSSHPATMITGLSNVAISGSYNDLTDLPTGYTHPSSHPATMITGLASVATSGNYNDLANKPATMTPTEHIHAQSDITGLTSALAGKADSTHTHSNYAASSHTHSNYAASTHTHSNYAASTHTHTASEVGAAASSHTHSNYATTSHTHTAIANDLDVQGVIRADGVQAVFFSGTNSILGSGNYPTIIAGTETTLNGTKTYAPNIYPRGTGTFTLGASSNRWTNIYSKNAVNVSSDERLKENIKDVDETKSAEFINKIEIKNYNYIGDENEKIGIIAQQLIEADPELSRYFVHQDEKGYFGVTTADLIFPLIAAVQKLTKEVEELKKGGK